MKHFAYLAFTALLLTWNVAQADVRITEFMSEGQGLTGPGTGAARRREFFEITNLGNAAVDVSEWTYNDDNPNDPHPFGAAFGALAAGESAVLTQMPVVEFRSLWNLPGNVKIYSIGDLSNLGNADTLNIYSSSTQSLTTLVDSLQYTETARGSGISRNRPRGGQGQSPNSFWVESSVGDVFDSRLAPNPPGAEYIDLGNPGLYVPEPSTLLLAAVGLSTLVCLPIKRKVTR